MIGLLLAQAAPHRGAARGAADPHPRPGRACARPKSAIGPSPSSLTTGSTGAGPTAPSPSSRPRARASPATTAAEFHRRPALLDEIVVEEDRARWVAHAQVAARQAGGRAVAPRVPHPDARRAGALDRPRLLAGDRRGRDASWACAARTATSPTRSGRSRSCERRSPRSSGCASGSRPTTPTCASRSSRRRASRGSSAGATCCATCCPRSQQVAPTVEHGAAPGRDGRRQGAGRPRDPQPEPAPGPAARQAQLRGAAALARRERALRAREGRLHRRRSPSARGASRSPTAARSSSTRSASCRSSCRPSSCA